MKELPYFKFYCNEWITGDINFLSLETQGLFINLCSYYWSKDCDITLFNCKKRFSTASEQSFKDLIDMKIIKIVDEKVVITFLNEQLNERTKLSKTNSNNGKKGAEKKRHLSETQATAKPNISETQATLSNKEEKRREEIKKDINSVSISDSEKENMRRNIFDDIDHMNENEVFKDLLKDWTNHLLEKGKKLTVIQIQTFANNNKQIYGKNAMLFRQDVYFTIENGYLGLVRKHLKEAGFDEYTGKKIPQFDGDYTAIPYYSDGK